MSDKDAKKGGARDISDLKARLGLKKGAQTGAATAMPQGGRPGAIPPPPGVAPPPGPQVPDARVDPFAAMNAMAAQGAVVAAPQEIVIRAEDSKLIKGVRTKSRLEYVKYAAMVLVPLILGFIIGGISYANKTYNRTIVDAGKLTAEVRAVGKGLQSLNDTLLVARERGPDGNSFVVNDKELTAALKALKLEKPDRTRLFHSWMYNMDPSLVEDTFTFYSDLINLYDRVDKHVRQAEADEKKISKQNPTLKALGTQARFGIIFNVPKQGENGVATAEIVELGAPVCSDTKPHPEGCGQAAPTGFQYRPDPTIAQWGSKAWSRDQPTLESILLMGSGNITQAMTVGAEPFVDEVGYMNRIKEIMALTTEINAERKIIEDRLNQKAQESKRFSF